MTHPSIAALTPSFTGKVVFITGAGAGFGRDFAVAFASAGAVVVATDINLEAAQQTALLVKAAGGEAIALRCDVSNEAEVKSAVRAASEQCGGVDFLINNAGLHLMKYNQAFGKLGSEELHNLMNVNVMGVVYCTLACRDVMAARNGGAIVNISSIAGHMSPTPYGVSKLAVRGLTAAFARELKEHQIRVNAISPGVILTESAAALPKEILEQYLALQQIQRPGAMQDITSAALFLCSPAASFITGETLMVSGGYPLQI